MTLASQFRQEDRESIGTLFARLLEDGRRMARAEVKLVRETATFRLSQSTTPIGMLGAAFLLASASVTALLVGLIIWLAGMIGALGATLIVVLVALAIAGVLVKLAVARLKKIMAAPFQPPALITDRTT